MRRQPRHLARLLAIAVFFVMILLVLIWRMLDLTILDRKFLQGQGNARSLRVINIPAHRGMIIDREGAVLAVSTPLQSVWINPKLFKPTHAQLQQLAHVLHITPEQVQKRVSNASRKEFAYLQRLLDPVTAKEIRDLKIAGVNFQEEFRRYYPEADSMAQLLGFTNIDDHGIEGLELAYQDWLMGVSGQKRVLKDRMGRVIEELDLIKAPRPGNVLQLSIDRRIQFFAYHELQHTVQTFGAKSGSVVVLDAQTGEVLAAANYPSFNPNIRSHFMPDSYRNKALTDTFEPGSVIKPFSIASAMQTGQFTPSTIIDTRPSWMVVHGRTIRDVHNYGVLDVTGVLRHSSNVGVTKMVLASPPEQLIDLLLRCGIAQRTDSGYPGESEGSIVRARDANPFVLATLSFGYGMSVTVMQIARAYMIFANQGQLLPITFLYHPSKPEGTQVLQPAIANQLLTMLEAVVSDGTGKSSEVPGYRVAGKTGTARIAGKNGYSELRYTSSFVGIAPVSNPRLIVAVFIHEPSRGGYYGAQVASPLFAKVMGASLRVLDIKPDQEPK